MPSNSSAAATNSNEGGERTAEIVAGHRRLPTILDASMVVILACSCDQTVLRCTPAFTYPGYDSR